MFFQTFQEKRAVHELCRGIEHNKERFFTLQLDFIDTVNFAITQLINFERYVGLHNESFIAIIYRR